MTRTTARMSISLDGYVAGPDQSLEQPFGDGGDRLSTWQFETDQPGRAADAAILADYYAGLGAHVMGRHMFGGGDGPWDETWTGWWGDEPPFGAPVFVLTHHPRTPLVLGATTFTFVTEGLAAALEQARSAAGGRDVSVAGGASVVRQALRLGAIDELLLHLVPATLGAGERPLDEVGGLELAPVEVVASPTVTHLRYRVVR